MAGWGCMNRQEWGRVGMVDAVADMRCSGSFVGRTVDCLDIEGTVVVVVIVGNGRALVDIAEVAGSDTLMAEHSKILD